MSDKLQFVGVHRKRYGLFFRRILHWTETTKKQPSRTLAAFARHADLGVIFGRNPITTEDQVILPVTLEQDR